MRHRIIYQCERCGREFDDENECRMHELSHDWYDEIGTCISETLFWLGECMHAKGITEDERHQLRKAYMLIAFVKGEHKGE